VIEIGLDTGAPGAEGSVDRQLVANGEKLSRKEIVKRRIGAPELKASDAII
jgi:hypothetical protein